MPKISVLMPAYNVEKYINECLDSVVSQTLTDLEIICIDDGSTDGTAAILDEYAERDDRITLIHKENGGYGQSMNVALERATGDYVGIVETDDFIEPNMFERLYDLAIEKDVDVVKANYFDYYSNQPDKCKKTRTLDIAKAYNEVFSPEDNQRVFMVAPCIWSGLYRNSLIRDNNIRFTETPGASYQDTAFAFKIWACASSVFLIDEAYLHYRRDNENSSVNSPGKVFCICDEYDEIERFIAERGKHQFEGIKNAIKFNQYRWNYKRLNDSFKYDFLMRIVEDFKPLIDEKILDPSCFDEKRFQELIAIVSNPNKYYKATSGQKSKSVLKRMRKIISCLI